ncbi:hypothetical protein SDRG_17051 [Saprolegnia diclina VS20]|uniref:Impact N-terminal domain-containing protein n=1 Tax=Saprolegnia diclina (strain VS20) TaxID=1156394 RepID=T0PVN6_SAPDV|nr:hypothetical protein SDRG_17051 [Saprolegnia diclina VS20]EQC25075.1 hypothetical protein SDRG_17051 [Saprolegnia diclina VS20]|eukprot:XP_008621505.1 hypothetical protein SDRG_17051 [Saprolegnia diclina VS20]
MGRTLSAGPPTTVSKNTVQGFVVPIKHSSNVSAVIADLQTQRALRRATHISYAYRVIEMADDASDMASRAVAELYDVVEGAHDGGMFGAGDKLLYVLQRWDVHNVVLVVSRIDASYSGQLLGANTYKLLVESAKQALEQFAVDSLEPAEAAKLAMSELPPQLPPAKMEATKTTIAYEGGAYMVDGVVQGTKQGRINHFLADRSSNQSQDAKHETLRSLDALGISKDELNLLRAVRSPSKELHTVLVCVALLLHVKDVTWTGCRDMLHAPSFCAKVLRVTPEKLTSRQVHCVHAVLSDADLVPDVVRRASTTGAALLAWVQSLLDKYDEAHLGLSLGAVPAQPTARMDDTLLEMAVRLEPPSRPPPPEAHSVIPTDLFAPAKPPKIIDHGRLIKQPKMPK